MQEQKLERKLVNEIKKLGGKALKFVSPGTTGVPDRIVLLPGRNVIFVEMKSPGKKLSPIQEYRIKELRNLGFKVRVIDCERGIGDLIREVLLNGKD